MGTRLYFDLHPISPPEQFFPMSTGRLAKFLKWSTFPLLVQLRKKHTHVRIHREKQIEYIHNPNNSRDFLPPQNIGNTRVRPGWWTSNNHYSPQISVVGYIVEWSNHASVCKRLPDRFAPRFLALLFRGRLKIRDERSGEGIQVCSQAASSAVMSWTPSSRRKLRRQTTAFTKYPRPVNVTLRGFHMIPHAWTMIPKLCSTATRTWLKNKMKASRSTCNLACRGMK